MWGDKAGDAGPGRERVNRQSERPGQCCGISPGASG